MSKGGFTDKDVFDVFTNDPAKLKVLSQLASAQVEAIKAAIRAEIQLERQTGLDITSNQIMGSIVNITSRTIKEVLDEE
jgi:hypothetical protein